MWNVGKQFFTLFTDETIRKSSFDFSSIRDNFRQHIHNRKNSDVSDLILLDRELIENLIKLKQKSFELLAKFSKSTKEQSKVKSFSSFEEFVSFTMNEEEILSSEIWKLDAVSSFLNQLELNNSTTALVTATKDRQEI